MIAFVVLPYLYLKVARELPSSISVELMTTIINKERIPVINIIVPHDEHQAGIESDIVSTFDATGGHIDIRNIKIHHKLMFPGSFAKFSILIPVEWIKDDQQITISMGRSITVFDLRRNGFALEMLKISGSTNIIPANSKVMLLPANEYLLSVDPPYNSSTKTYSSQTYSLEDEKAILRTWAILKSYTPISYAEPFYLDPESKRFGYRVLSRNIPVKFNLPGPGEISMSQSKEQTAKLYGVILKILAIPDDLDYLEQECKDFKDYFYRPASMVACVTGFPVSHFKGLDVQQDNWPNFSNFVP